MYCIAWRLSTEIIMGWYYWNVRVNRKLIWSWNIGISVNLIVNRQCLKEQTNSMLKKMAWQRKQINDPSTFNLEKKGCKSMSLWYDEIVIPLEFLYTYIQMYWIASFLFVDACSMGWSHCSNAIEFSISMVFKSTIRKVIIQLIPFGIWRENTYFSFFTIPRTVIPKWYKSFSVSAHAAVLRYE